jgi:hypothetical protein
MEYPALENDRSYLFAIIHRTTTGIRYCPFHMSVKPLIFLN